MKFMTDKASVILFFLWFTPFSFTQWSSDPNTNIEVSKWGMLVTACSDDSGGVFVGWKNFSYEHTRAYLQYVDKYGNIKWNEPLIILDKGNMQSQPYLIEDGNGNCIAIVDVMKAIGRDPDGRVEYDNNIHLQKIDRNGNRLWNIDSLRMTLSAARQSIPLFVSDGKGGVLLFWGETRGVPGNYWGKKFIQRISANGERLLSDTGKVVADSLGAGIKPLMVSDGDGGVIIYYGSINSSFFERLDSNGNSLWKVKSMFGYEFYEEMISLNKQGVFVTGRLRKSGKIERDYIFNIIDIQGNFLENTAGISYVDSVVDHYSFYSKSFFDSAKNEIMTNYYHDNLEQLYYQRITLDGKLKYEKPGKQAPGGLAIESDSSYIFWDIINIDGIESITCFRIDGNDNYIWGQEGKTISTTTITGYAEISDKKGGFILVWAEYEPLYGIKAQQINKNGQLGVVLTKIEDNNSSFDLKDFTLYQNYPNPFNPTTRIQYSLNNRQYVSLKIYDVLGNELVTLVNEVQPAGVYKVGFDATAFSSGVYFYQLRQNNSVITKKMVLVK